VAFVQSIAATRAAASDSDRAIVCCADVFMGATVANRDPRDHPISGYPRTGSSITS
jgi:hypothetical protein